MGEDIEIKDVNGNVVTVPLYGTLALIASALRRARGGLARRNLAPLVGSR